MNSFGSMFRVSLFGESHSTNMGIVVDGVPPGIPFSETLILPELERRKPGLPGTTARTEQDKPVIISGLHNGRTTGAPLAIIIKNTNTDSSSYNNITAHPRPSHSDFSSRIKYNGWNDPRGGGYHSGRLTALLVCAGALAKTIIAPITVQASIQNEHDVREQAAQAAQTGDSIGAVLEVTITHVPAGLGEPWFNSAESLLAHAIFSIPGIKAIGFGAGFRAASMRGSNYNDRILDASGKTASNNDGGITGGITNGNPIQFRVAAKPTPSIGIAQETYSFAEDKPAPLTMQGRHDACFALRLPPVLEAVSALVMADLMLLRRAYAK